MGSLNIKIVGLGGIGSDLSFKVSKFFNYFDDLTTHICLIDGDDYEYKNLERQDFHRIGNKAKIKEEELRAKFSKISFDRFSEFISDKNVNIFKSGDIILLCVDNHKTRRIISNYADSLSDIILISGGNELLNGNVQIFIKKGDKKITPSLTDYHPEILNATDKLPSEMSCEELSNSEPQLYFVNIGVSTLMCWALYNIVIKNQMKYSEVYFDVPTMMMDSKIRKVQNLSI